MWSARLQRALLVISLVLWTTDVHAEVADKVPSTRLAVSNLVVRFIVAPAFFFLSRRCPRICAAFLVLCAIELWFAVTDFALGDLAGAVVRELGILYLWSWPLAALVIPMSIVAGLHSRRRMHRVRGDSGADPSSSDGG